MVGIGCSTVPFESFGGGTGTVDIRLNGSKLISNADEIDSNDGTNFPITKKRNQHFRY